MDSDFERAKVIIKVSDKSKLSHNNIEQISMVLRNMDSDFERSKVMVSLAKNVRLESPDIMSFGT